jgi:hypothetical protein
MRENFDSPMTLAGDDAEPDLALDRAEMMRACRSNGDRADNVNLIHRSDVRKVGAVRRRQIATSENLMHEHFGDVLGVSVACRCLPPSW